MSRITKWWINALASRETQFWSDLKVQRHECYGEKCAVEKKHFYEEDLSHHMLNSDFISLQVTKDFRGR